MDLASNDHVKAAQELLEKAGEILREEQEKDKITACRFNVFNALGVERAELAHSQFLACLLDPKGTHDQKDLFLRTFLQDVLLEETEGLDLVRSEVRTEAYIEKGKLKGKLDVLVTLPNRQIIIIENKVYAGEGEEQLEKYRNWLQSQPQAKSGRPHHLVFLTPDGRSPSSCSSAEVKLVSYGSIADWLDRLKVPLRLEVVLGHVNLWRAIPMNQEIIALLRDQRNFETAERISMVVEEIKDQAKRQFMVRVHEDLKNRLHQSNLGENWGVLDATHIGKYAYVGILWRGRKENLMRFAVLCEVQDPSWDEIIIGISRGNEIQEDKLAGLDKEVFQMLSERDGVSLRKSRWWTGYFDLGDLLGRKTIGVKGLINENLGGEHQIAEQTAKGLWEIFERCRIELENLNRNYPYSYLDASTRKDLLTGTTA